MPETIDQSADLTTFLIRLETVLARIEDRLEEAAHVPLIEAHSNLARPFLADDLTPPRDLFSFPLFHIDSPS